MIVRKKIKLQIILICLAPILFCAMAVQAPKMKTRKNTPAKSACVKAAHKLLEFAVKEVYYYPEPEDELDDERVESVDKGEDFMDRMFRRALHSDTSKSKDPTLKNLKKMESSLPEIIEKTVRRSSPDTRRTQWSKKISDFWYEGFIDRDNPPNVTEEYKQDLVKKLSLAWLLNGRRFIYRSLDYRKPIMDDKRYKIGFLFHALRMNVFDQHKLLQGVQQQEGDKRLRNFENTLFVYQKIVRMNVDLNDIISYLRLLHYHQPDPIIRLKKPKKQKIFRH